MIELAALFLLGFVGHAGYLLGQRRVLGQIELEVDEREQISYDRSLRPGTVRLNTIQIRR